jgi:hypothetical protein
MLVRTTYFPHFTFNLLVAALPRRPVYQTTPPDIADKYAPIIMYVQYYVFSTDGRIFPAKFANKFLITHA